MNGAPTREAVGPYRVLRALSQDEQGEVYAVCGPDQDVPVALRVLPAGAALQDTDLASGLPAAGLRHPNIVPVQDSGWEGDRAYVVTPMVEAETLSQYAARVGRLPALQALALASQLLSALDFAHARGVVHGALHPRHILVSRTGQLKVTGFGWAAIGTAGDATTDPYHAPEQRTGGRADHRADLYAAAAVIHELLAGTPPVRTNGTPALVPVRAGLPDGAGAVLARALAPDPAARWDEAAQLLAALQTAYGVPLWERPRKDNTRSAAVATTAVAERPVGEVASPRTVPAVLERLSLQRFVPRPLAYGLALAAAVMVAAAILWAMSFIGGPRPTARAPADVVGHAPPQAPTHAGEPPAAGERKSPSLTPPPVDHPVPSTPDLEPPTASSLENPAVPPQRSPSDRSVAEASPAPAAGAAASNASERVGRSAGMGHAAAPLPVTRTPPPQGVRRSASRGSRPARGGWAQLDCGGPSGFGRELCAVVQCAKAEYRRHPICVQMHADGRARQLLAESRGGP